ncbi:Serine/threonine-protein phosphatase 5 [Clydaea vesicula]|uniref:Serine/threonine-protein phosphatase T n=1 Tax=Clydaea vesicula TaxID=447962 RepID=A0AAD5U2M4_9FUNG|nr:Serine/threonine-protein phosphatase 5 [Clydaea vesicula]
MMSTATENLKALDLDITEKDILKAEEIKALANKLFSDHKYNDAVEQYTLAISYNPKVPAYYTNRAICYLKTEFYGAAVRDADKAIELDKNYVKGYYRRAVGNMALGNFKEAVKDFRNVCKVAPNDRDARLKLIECEKEFKRIEFEKAIACDEHFDIVERIGNVDEIVLEQSYSGPHLPSEGGITLEFIKEMMECFKTQGKLHRKYVLKLLMEVKQQLEKLESLVDITIPSNGKITVCGDIHGQYYDLLNIFEKNGLPSETNMYLFNGDFVDRGSFSVECILTLLSFKLLYPNAMHLSRGNHEANDMNKVYGFEGEVVAKYNELTFKLFSEVFNAVPLGQVIGGKILVIHGGLFSRDDVSLDEVILKIFLLNLTKICVKLRKINRFRQPGHEGLMCELLWSDPQPELGRSPSKRGVGIQFGPDVTENFLKFNNLDLLIRSHEVKQDGYTADHNGKCITIFSAPNYCDSVGNKGAYIHITPDLKLKYNQFVAVSHPQNVKPMQYAGNM